MNKYSTNFASVPNSNNTGLNNQTNVLRDFLALFTATQNEGTTGVDGNGSWEEIQIASSGNKDTIRKALFGDGTQAGGLINSDNLQLGGTATALGSLLTAESLGILMGNIPGVDYAAWVNPLQDAMIEFGINTPQRIAAFLAQIRAESRGLRTTTEDLHYLSPASAASKFGVFGGSGSVGIANATTYYQTVLIRPGQATNWYTNSSNWLPDQLEQFGNYVYATKNGNNQVGDGWKFRGHGLTQTTGRANTQAFADYVDLHPIAGQPTGTQIMNDPETYISQNKYMAARSAGLYWSQRVTNPRADALDENNHTPPNFTYTGTAPNLVPHYVPGNPFTDSITLNVGRDVASFRARWQYWRDNVGLAYTGGNPYESMREALTRVGIKTINATDYESQFGIALQVQKPLEIGGGIHPLMAETIKNDAALPADIVLDDPMQALLTDAKNALGFNEGEYTMFIADQPNVPPSTPPVVMMAQANSNQQPATEV